jgi:D-3-phosphoglycerate dehydrogenase
LEKSGVQIAAQKDEKFSAYRSAIKIVIQGKDQNGSNLEWKIGGTVFEDTLQRLSLIEGFYFEVEPKGNLLIFENHDEPGVVGNIGTLLGTNGVNIQSFDLARNRQQAVKTGTGIAMAVVRTDSEVSKDLLRQLKELPHVRAAWSLVL